MANLSNLTNNEIIFDDIFNKINTNVTQAVKETLTPFISKMKEEKSIYQEIVSVMKKMPEFKKIINENEVLVNENGLLVNENGLLLKERDYLLKFGVVKKVEQSEREEVEPRELVVKHVEKSNELLVIVPEEKEEEQMPVYIEEKKVIVLQQNKQSITLEITNHHETILEDNLDDKIKQIYLDANLLDSQPQSATSSASASEAEAEASASEGEASEGEASEAEEDLVELVDQLNDAAQSEEEEEAQSEAQSEAEEEEQAQQLADEDLVDASDNEIDESEEVESDSEPEEVFIVDIKDKGQFYTTDEQNGDIYEILVDSNDDIGDKIGKFKDGKAIYF